MYSAKQMQNTSVVSPSPDELRAQRQGLPRARCCPSPSCLPAVLAAGTLPSCQAAKPRSCPSHPSCALCTLVSSTPPLRGWCRASPTWAGAAVWFEGWVGYVHRVCTRAWWQGRELGDPQSCPVTLCSFWSHSSLLGAVPERRELRLPRQMCLPARLDGASLPDRYGAHRSPPGSLRRACPTATGELLQGAAGLPWGSGGPLPTDGPRGGGQGPWLLTKPWRVPGATQPTEANRCVTPPHPLSPTPGALGQRCLMIRPGKDGKLSSQSSDPPLAA